MFLLLVNAHSRSQMHKNLIKYTVDTYDHVLTDEHKEMLRKESKKATSEEGRIYDYHRGQTESASIDFNELITTKDFAALFHRRDNDREDK